MEMFLGRSALCLGARSNILKTQTASGDEQDFLHGRPSNEPKVVPQVPEKSSSLNPFKKTSLDLRKIVTLF